MNEVESAPKRRDHISVTGASGFVGTALVNMLLLAGYDVDAFVHQRNTIKIPQSDRLRIFTSVTRFAPPGNGG